MAIRTIEYTVTKDGITPQSQQFGGIMGDHKATELLFTLDENLFESILSESNGNRVVYRFDGYDGSGCMDSTVPQELTEKSCSYMLEEWITRHGGNIKVYLVITEVMNDTTEMELYSFPAILRLKSRPDGVQAEEEVRESLATLVESAKSNAERAEKAAEDSAEDAATIASKVAAEKAVENVNNFFYRTAPIAVGSVFPFAGTEVPDTFMLCDGAELNTVEYKELFDVIGYTYGGEGDVFKLPDYRGRVLVGQDKDDTDFDTIGEKGGKKTHLLTEDEMPQHTGHVASKFEEIYNRGSAAGKYLNPSNMSNSGTVGRGWSDFSGEIYPTALSKGGNLAHNNLQPYAVLNFIIKVTQQSNAKREFDEELNKLDVALDEVNNLSVRVIKTDNKSVITITDKTGTVHTAEVLDGKKGDNGDKGDSGKDADMSIVANALKGNVSGNVVVLNDVSPLPHDVKVHLDNGGSVTVCGKNLFDKSKTLINGIKGETAVGVKATKIMEHDAIVQCLKPNIEYTLSYEIECLSIPENATIRERAVGLMLRVKGGSTIVPIKYKPLAVGDVLKYTDNFTLTDEQYNSGTIDILAYGNAYLSADGNKEVYPMVVFRNIKIEVGTTATEYEPFVEPTTYTADADGKLTVPSIYPSMTIFAEDGATMSVEYNRDINKLEFGGTPNLDNYCTKNEVDGIVGDIETLLGGI